MWGHAGINKYGERGTVFLIEEFQQIIVEEMKEMESPR